MTQPIPLTLFYKNPTSILEYTIDWSQLSSDDNPIISGGWTASGLVIESNSFTSTTSTALVSGGLSGNTYFLTGDVTITDGVRDSQTIQVEVRDVRDIHSLVLELRLHLGDLDPQSYRYMDKWLVTALLASTRALQKWWDYKYLVDYNLLDIYRNPQKQFTFPEPPVVEDQDVRPIILMASIIIKKGQLENQSWNIGSWRDNEIAVSNIEGGKTKTFSIKDDWDELKSILKPPQNKLAGPIKGRLPGYFNTEG